MKRSGKHVALDSEQLEYVLRYWQENSCSDFSEALRKIINEHKTQGANALVATTIAEMAAESVVSSLKRTYLDPLRIRTGYADKQTKILMEMLNHVIVKNGWDDTNVVTTDHHKSNVYAMSEEKIVKQIEHFKQRKASKEVAKGTNDE
ncbi:hypothetical protein BCR26_08700 [Enterococcus rivorum]|uniref:Uncharacterized protein n=1 Tax=Enterococcus rivorum TaxID=762845 RepID=A0A1E5L0E1_9ENTE|nr:hypothetical protein BCR26_08700 [Enterococcus rivorum]